MTSDFHGVATSGTSPAPWRTLLILLCIAAISLVSGCVGYSVGPTGGQTAGARSVQIIPFTNETLEPRLIEPLTHALRKQVQQDGTFRLATRESGHIVVTGRILRYHRNPLTFQTTDVFTTRDYDVRMTAWVQVQDASTGRLLVDQEVSGFSTVRNVADLTSAERQAVPLISEDLARNILSLFVDGIW